MYQILEIIEAGIVLQGTEAKSIRQGMSTMSDAHAYIKNNELFLANLNVNVYEHGNRYNHDPLRLRKLLVHKREIQKLRAAVEEKGKTLIATCLYYVKGRVKVEIAIAVGKKLHDKRQDSKEKQQKKEMARALKHSKR